MDDHEGDEYDDHHQQQFKGGFLESFSIGSLEGSSLSSFSYLHRSPKPHVPYHDDDQAEDDDDDDVESTNRRFLFGSNLDEMRLYNKRHRDDDPVLRQGNSKAILVKQSRKEDDLMEMRELPSNWRSALVVSSLHRAYQSTLQENRKLRASLRSAEKRCADLLISPTSGMTGFTESIGSTTTRTAYVVDEETQRELQKLRRNQTALENDIARIREELSTEREEKLQLVRWKTERLAQEKGNVSSLRQGLEQASVENTRLVDEMVELHAMLSHNREALGRVKSGATQVLCGALKRWGKEKLRRGWRSWVLRDRKVKQILDQREEKKQREERRMRLAKRAIARLRWRKLSLLFSKWQENTVKQRIMRNRLRGVVFRVKFRMVSKSFNAWVDFRRKRKILRDFLRRMVTRVLYKKVYAAFFTWHRVSMWIKHQQLIEQHETLTNEFQIANEQFTNKIDHMQRMHMYKMHMIAAKTVGKWQGQLLRWVFFGWKQTAFQNRFNRKRKFFNTWFEHARIEARHRRILTRYAAKVANQRLAIMFRTWSDNAHLIRCERVKVTRFVARVSSSLLGRCFNSWATYTSNRKTRRAKAQHVFAVLAQKTLVIRFAQWKRFKEESKKEKAAMDVEEQRKEAIRLKFVRRLRNRRILAVFESWLDYCQVRRFLRSVMSRLLLSVTHKSQMQAFVKWRQFATHDFRTKMEVELFQYKTKCTDLQEELEKISKDRDNLRKELGIEITSHNEHVESTKLFHQTRIIALWRNKRLANAFHHFHAQVQSQKNERNTLRAFVQRWQNRALFHVLASWHEFVNRRKLLRHFLRSMSREKAKRLCEIAFRTWSHYVNVTYHEALHAKIEFETKRANMLQEKLEEFEAIHKVAHEEFVEKIENLQSHHGRVCDLMSRKIVGKMDDYLLERSFDALKQYVRGKLRKRRLLKRATMKLGQHALSKSFNQWFHAARLQKRQRDILSRVTWQTQNRNTARAFRAWYNAKEARKHLRVKAELLLKRKSRHVFYRCFLRWKEVVDEAIEKKDRAKHVFAELSDNIVLRRFHQWKKYTVKQKQDRLERLESDMVVSRVIGRMRRTKLSRAFVSWHERAVHQCILRERVTRFTNRWRMIKVALTFDNWVNRAREQQRIRMILRQCVVRLENVRLCAGFSKWATFVRHSFMETIDQYVQHISQLQANLDQAAWDRQAMESRFGEEYKHLQAHRDRIRERHADRVVLHFRQGLSLQIFEAWRMSTLESRRSRIRVNRFIKRLQNIHLSRSFNGWVCVWQAKRRKRVLMARGVTKFQGNLMAYALQSWRSALEETRLRRRLLTRMGTIMRRILHVQKYRAFHTWTYWCHVGKYGDLQSLEQALRGKVEKMELTAEQLREMCLRKAMASWMKPLLVRTFVTWKSNVKTILKQRRSVETYTFRMQNLKTGAAFRGWQAYLENERLRKSKIRSLVHRWSKHVISLAFRMWIKASNMEQLLRLKSSTNENMVLYAINRGRRVNLHRNFLAWRRTAKRCKGQRLALKKIELYVKRLRFSRLIPAINQWKLNTFAHLQRALHLNTRRGMVDQIRCALHHVVCNGILFADFNTHQGSNDNFVPFSSPRGGSVFSQTGQVIGEAWEWGVVAHSVGRATRFLFDSDSLGVFEVHDGALFQYDTMGNIVGEHSLGTSITASVVQTGQIIALEQARTDSRFRPSVDDAASNSISYHQHETIGNGDQHNPFIGGISSSGVVTQSGFGGGTTVVSAPNRRTSLSASNLHIVNDENRHQQQKSMIHARMRKQSSSKALIIVPILDPENRAVGVIQASKTFRDGDDENKTNSNNQSTKEMATHYLEACNTVLTVAADTLANLLEWRTSFKHIKNQYENTAHERNILAEEREGLREKNLSLANSKKKAEALIASMKKEKGKKGPTDLDLQLAYEKIKQLEAQTSSVSKFEHEVKKLIQEYDHAITHHDEQHLISPPMSPVSGGVSTATRPRYISSRQPFQETILSDEFDLGQLEHEQRELAMKIGNAKSKFI